MRTLNLGILAHVDAGKTTLTERLLYAAGVIDEIGSVDDGNTQTDSLALEQKRGITIKSAVVSFDVDGVKINLIDTPGHPDFIAEVERVLGVLDGAVLVVSAVEGVQAQTRVLMRTLQRLNIPTLVFVNKVDRRGARCEDLLRDISEKLTPAMIPMGSVGGLGTRGAVCTPYDDTDPGFVYGLIELLADHDEALLAQYVDGKAISYGRLRRGLASQTGRALVSPVFFGSAVTGAGVDTLISGITELLPRSGGDAGGPVSGTVFKVERGRAGEKVAYVRMFFGTVKVRDLVRFGRDDEAKVTAIDAFEHGSSVRHDAVPAGHIGKLWGLGDVQVGDEIGGVQRGSPLRHHFAPPTLETIVEPCRAEDGAALYAALVELADQDPLIGLRQDDARREIFLSLYGEVQKEVIGATLADEYGLEVTFRGTMTICVERPAGTGAAVEIIDVEPNPFLATVGLRIEPAEGGPRFRPDKSVHGTMPAAFFTAVEETVEETLREGLYGWRVTDCTVTLTHTGYWPRQSSAHGTFDKSMSSTAGDFRGLTRLVLMDALKRAGTRVCEPMHRFELEIPADTFGATSSLLARLGASPRTQELKGPAYTLWGEIPAARVHELEQRLPALTRGEGVLLESVFDHYSPVRGEVPTRPRTDDNPLDREEYLLRLTRRV
jgi:ribosomal protection tetracycline resistance protein